MPNVPLKLNPLVLILGLVLVGLPSISAPHINSEVIDCGISGVIPVKSRSVFSGIRTATFPVLLIASFHVVISVTETRVYPLGI